MKTFNEKKIHLFQEMSKAKNQINKNETKQIMMMIRQFFQAKKKNEE